MKVYQIILIFILFSAISNLEYGRLSINGSYTLKSDEESLHLYHIPLTQTKYLPSEIKLETKIIESKNPSSATVGFHYEPFSKNNYDKIKKEVLGKTVILDSEFIQSALDSRKSIFLGIYCENCVYKLYVKPSGLFTTNINFVQTQPLRKLEVPDVTDKPAPDTKPDERIDVFSANGICGIFVAFFIIFVCAITCIIMMKIYVHGSALVEQPLKFGRIEG